MLGNLSVRFLVTGSGAETLNKIKKSYSELNEKLKKPLKFKIADNFKNLFTSFSNAISKIGGGTNKFSNLFSSVFGKIGLLGRGTFARIRNSLGKLSNFNITGAMINGFKKFSNYSTEVFEKANKKANMVKKTFLKLMGILSAGAMIKIGIDGASGIEQYRNTLETVLKDPLAAQKKLAWASRFANKTPYETDEVVGGMTKLQSYGIEGDRILKTTKRTYLEMIGDMAAGMGKSFDQAIEAVADSKTGELERLKEFGITKNMIGDYGKNNGYGELFNNKGQIKDVKLFNKALFELMNSRFGGAMEKQAKTFKGAISTIKGVLKSGLSSLMGIDEFGNVVENSPFQLLRDKVLIPLSEKLIEMQENGVFTKWAENFAEGIKKLLNFSNKVINTCIKWKEVLIPLASAITGLYAINKVTYLIGALKVALATFSFNPIMIGIGALIALGVLLYRNWDVIKDKFKEVIGNIINGFKFLYEIITFTIKEVFNVFKSLYERAAEYSGVFNFLIPGKIVLEGIYNFYKSWNSSLGIIDNLKNGFSIFFQTLKKGITEGIEAFARLGQKIKNLPFIKKIMAKLNISADEEVPENIDGSHKSGLDYVPYNGYIAELHKGERVLTATENKGYKKSGGNTYQLIFNITEAAAGLDYKKLGDYVVQVIKRYEEEKEVAEGVI